MFYHYDGLGSTRALSDDVGALTDEYSYEAFGEELNRTGATENDYLFAGEQYDANLDNYYLRARYYDQGIGRFTQKDTWMGKGCAPITLNKYIYADSNPANGIDPSGNMTIAVQMNAINIQGIFSTISIRTVAKAFLVSATATTTYVLLNREAEQLWMMAETHVSPNVRSDTDRVAYEGNRREYKNRCQERPPEGGSHCDKWRWELRRNNDCADMRQEFANRWFNGTDDTHQQAIDEMRKASAKLETKINRLCN